MNTTHQIERYQDIEGFLSNEDADTLQEFARASRHLEGNAIEIGAFKGLSAVVLLDALPEEKKLTSVEIGNYPEFFKSIESRSHTHRSSLVITGFREYPFHKEKYCLAFIDHNHTYDDNIDCFNMVMPSVVIGGFVLFHDVGHGDYPDVETVVNEIEKNRKDVKLIRKKFTSVFQKIR